MSNNTQTAQPTQALPGYKRVEVTIAAVFDEDAEAVRDELEAVCRKYLRARASIQISPCDVGTELNPVNAEWLPQWLRDHPEAR